MNRDGCSGGCRSWGVKGSNWRSRCGRVLDSVQLTSQRRVLSRLHQRHQLDLGSEDTYASDRVTRRSISDRVSVQRNGGRRGHLLLACNGSCGRLRHVGLSEKRLLILLLKLLRLLRLLIVPLLLSRLLLLRLRLVLLRLLKDVLLGLHALQELYLGTGNTNAADLEPGIVVGWWWWCSHYLYYGLR